MIRVTKPGKYTIIDIQNMNNEEICTVYKNEEFARGKNKGIKKIIRFFINIAKYVIKDGVINWHFIQYCSGTYPEDIYKHLYNCGLNDYNIFLSNENDSKSFIETRERSSFKDFGRLVFCIRKIK